MLRHFQIFFDLQLVSWTTDDPNDIQLMRNSLFTRLTEAQRNKQVSKERGKKGKRERAARLKAPLPLKTPTE